METAIFIAALLTLCLGRLRLRYTVPADGSYMSHDRTMMINGLFLVCIIFLHLGDNGYEPEGVDNVFWRYFISSIRWLMVTTFFFYSGYGIMSSIRKKGNAYVHDLLHKRFVRLYLHFALASFAIFTVSAVFAPDLLAVAIKFLRFIIGLGDGWFIVMTLAVYLLTWISFRICGADRPLRAIGLLFLLIFALSVLLLPLKPLWWVVSLPCFAAGAAYCALQPRIDSALATCRLPVSVLGAALIAFAVAGSNMAPTLNYYAALILHLPPEGTKQFFSMLIIQLMTTTFALGVTWLFAGISWQRIPSFLKWFGGPAVFSVYMWHGTAMSLFRRAGLNTACPSLFVLVVFTCSVLLGWLGIRLFKAVDRAIWPDSH